MAKKEKPPSSKTEAPADAEALQALERARERTNFVEVAAASGMPHEEIALLLVPPITVEELRAHYSLQLEMGPAKANLEVSAGLLKSARSGNVTAMIYWTKSRMGWTERAGVPSEKPAASETAPPAAVPPTAGLFGAPLRVVPKS